MAFYGKIVLITGGASGIGKTHAVQLARQGATVVILDLNEQALAETARLSDHIRPFRCDVTDIQQVRTVAATVEREIGPVDRLINCAAIMPGGLLLASSAEEINRIMLINYCGMVNVCQTIVPGIVQRNRGDVIVYGSSAGIIPAEKFGAYGATKSANNFYMEVLMEENKHTAVRFQLVCPPAVDTPLINQAKDTGPSFLKDIQVTRKLLMSPEDVVASVEKCLEKGRRINYPGPIWWIVRVYALFPGFVKRVAGK